MHRAKDCDSEVATAHVITVVSGAADRCDVFDLPCAQSKSGAPWRTAVTSTRLDASAPVRPDDANVHRRTTTPGRRSAIRRLEAFYPLHHCFESPPPQATTHARWRYATNTCASRSLPATPVQPLPDPSKFSRRVHMILRPQQKLPAGATNPWADHSRSDSQPTADQPDAGCATWPWLSGLSQAAVRERCVLPN